MAARSIRRRVAGRTAVVLAAVVVMGLMPASVGAAPFAGASPASPTTDAKTPKAERRAPQFRGRVDMSKAASEHGGKKDRAAEPAPRDASVESPVTINAAPPTVFASQNATASPTLTKIGVLPPVGDSNYAEDVPMVAAGPDHVIRSDQLWYRVSNRTGGSTQVHTFKSLLLQPNSFDAKEGYMFYVPSIGRWFAMSTSIGYFVAAGNQICNLGELDFAVSDTANPNGTWSVYYYEYPNATIVRPRFGSSSDKFVITVQIGGEDAPPAACGPGQEDGNDLTVNQWSDVLASDQFTSDYYFFPGAVFYPANGTGTILVPSVANNPGTPDLQVMASNLSSGHDILVTVSGPVPGTDISTFDLTGGDVIPPLGEPIQAGVSSYSGRTRTAVLHDERLVTALTEACTPAGDSAQRHCVRLVDLDVSGTTPVALQDFYLASSGKDTFAPGIAFADTGDLVLTYQQSSAGVTPSAYVIRQAPTDAPNTVSVRRQLQASGGSAVNLGSIMFVGASPDPLVPDAVWVTNNVGTSSSFRYETQTAQARTATGDTYVPIDPVRILDTRFGTGLSNPFFNSVPRTFNVAGAAGGAVPANAVAITGNVTVVDQQSAGYLAVGPSLTATPATSTINFPFGDTRANNLTLPLNSDGDLMAVFKGPPNSFTNLILDVTGYFLADDTGATYQPVTAVRKLDTRFGTGLSGRFQINVPRSFQITGGSIPSNATAVTGNLTVVGQSKRGYVTLTPASDANPDTSTINFPVGDTRANGVTVPLSDTGKLWAVYKASGGSTDLIFDVTGYYVDGTSGLRFFPLNPGRIMDTRFNTLTQLFGPFASSAPRTLVTGGHFGVPANALAITGNLTVVGQTKAGYVSITKDPTANPPVSTINFPAADIRANGITVPLNAANDLALVYKAPSGAKTNLIMDITGYFR